MARSLKTKAKSKPKAKGKARLVGGVEAEIAEDLEAEVCIGNTAELYIYTCLQIQNEAKTMCHSLISIDSQTSILMLMCLFAFQEPSASAVLGKGSSFLLRDGIAPGQDSVLNDALATGMIAVRPRYLFEASKSLLARPMARRGESGWLKMSDCNSLHLVKALDLLCSKTDSLGEYLVEAEAAFLMGPAGSGVDCTDAWAALWVKVIKQLVEAAKSCDGDQRLEVAHLPKHPGKLFNQGGLRGMKGRVSASASGGSDALQGQGECKRESDTAVKPGAAGQDKSNKNEDEEEEVSACTFHEVLNMCDLGNKEQSFHTNVLAVQFQIEQYFVSQFAWGPQTRPLK